MPSTVISTMQYDESMQILIITFVSGMMYDYKEVPLEAYLALKTSGAKGIYLNQHNKGKYPFQKVR